MQDVLPWLQHNLWWLLIVTTIGSKICKSILARFFDDESSAGARIVWFFIDVFDIFSHTPIPKRVKPPSAALIVLAAVLLYGCGTFDRVKDRVVTGAKTGANCMRECASECATRCVGETLQQCFIPQEDPR